jgi:hypothetical protein
MTSPAASFSQNWRLSCFPALFLRSQSTKGRSHRSTWLGGLGPSVARHECMWIVFFTVDPFK